MGAVCGGVDVDEDGVDDDGWEDDEKEDGEAAPAAPRIETGSTAW